MSEEKMEKYRLYKLLDFYEDELSMWELVKKKAVDMGRSAVVYKFNIDRIEKKIAHVKELIE